MPPPHPGQHWKHGYIPLDQTTARRYRHKWTGGDTTTRPDRTASENTDGWIRGAAKGKAPRKITTSGGPPTKTPPPVSDTKTFLARYDDWKAGLTPAQDKAMRFYQSPGFALMNGQLRGADPARLKAEVHATDADLKRARAASAALKQAIRDAPPLDRDTTVYRGFDAAQFGDLTPGKIVTDKGFTSTSLTNDAGAVGRAKNAGQATIVLPKGTRAAAGSARELVLPPGAKFKVIDVKRRGGVSHVTMELIFPGREG